MKNNNKWLFYDYFWPYFCQLYIHLSKKHSFAIFVFLHFVSYLLYPPKTEVRRLFSKFFTANILFWEYLGVVCFRPKNQKFL